MFFFCVGSLRVCDGPTAVGVVSVQVCWCVSRCVSVW